MLDLFAQPFQHCWGFTCALHIVPLNIIHVCHSIADRILLIFQLFYYSFKLVHNVLTSIQNSHISTVSGSKIMSVRLHNQFQHCFTRLFALHANEAAITSIHTFYNFLPRWHCSLHISKTPCGDPKTTNHLPPDLCVVILEPTMAFCAFFRVHRCLRILIM